MTRLALTVPMPWLAEAQASVERAIRSDHLGHALLVHAAAGVGGDWLAFWIAARVFCSAPANQPRPCGACIDCRRVLAGEHPDCSLVAPEETSKEIKIDQVRELCQDLRLTSHGGRLKVALVMPADRMNRFAANALLKTLEEPTPGTLLVLVAAQPSRLPATIRSRCQSLPVRAPSLEESLSWLAGQASPGIDWRAVLAVLGLRPLDALGVDPARIAALQRETAESLLQALRGGLDPVHTADRWSRDDLGLRLAAIENWITDRVREWAGGSADSAEMRADPYLPEPHATLNIRALFEALDGVREARRLEDTPVNKALLLERLLWRLTAAGGNRARTQAREQGNR